MTNHRTDLPYLLSATVSDVDGKIRLVFDSRLPQDVYDALRRAGFQWWPKQALFAAAFAPYREDAVAQYFPAAVFESQEDYVQHQIAAAERAERFQAHADTHQSAANRAIHRWDDIGHNAAAADKAQYWQNRATAALKHQACHERADVVYRRIQKLEAEKRKSERMLTQACATHAQRATAQRWITFYERRLAFEQALYEASGGIAIDQRTPETGVELEVGGALEYWGGVREILKVNPKSVTVKTEHATTATVRFDQIKRIYSMAQWHELNPAAAQKPTLTFVVGGGIEVESRHMTLRYEIISAARGRVNVKMGKGTRSFKQAVVKCTFTPDEWQALQAQGSPTASFLLS